MQKLTSLACTEFLDRLASASPTPGGGGASALSGAIAVALASMVVNLTVGKPKFGAVEAEVEKLWREAEALRAELLGLVEQDAAVFEKFMTCYKLPKATETQKQVRQEAIQNAAKEAALVPLNIARASAKIVVLAERLAVIGNPNVLTDAKCGMVLAQAAVRCAAYNVAVNLELTQDEGFNKSIRAEIVALEAQAHVRELKDEIMT